MIISTKVIRNVLLILLSVLIITLVSAPVCADEQPIIENSDNPQESTEVTSNSNNNESVSEPDETAQVNTQATATSGEEEAPIEDPILELLPPVPGNNIFTGAAGYSIPIEVPPGRNQIKPDLALKYNSYTKNGWVGVGWSLDMGAIQRSTKHGVDYSANDYVFVKNGSITELVHKSGNDYGAKIEGGFTQYYLDPSGGWVVTTKDGTRYYYGTASISRQENSHGTFKWCLDKVEDTNGNYMTISYLKDQGQIYLDRIDYTGNTNIGVEGTKYVRFIRQNRNDVYTMYNTKAKVRTASILNWIETYSNGQLARKYELFYGNGTTSDRYRLTKIKVCGSDGSSTLPPQTFQYREGGNGTFIGGGTTNLGNTTGEIHFVEVNGDGLVDLLITGVLGYKTYTYLSNGAGTFTYNGQTNLNPNGKVHFGDVNGDGRADIIAYLYSNDPYWQANQVTTYFSNGNGTFTYGGMTDLSNTIGNTTGETHFVEANGDGLVDLLITGVLGDPNKIYTYLSSGAGTFTYNGQTYVNRLGKDHFGDVNGDGLTDLITYFYGQGWGWNQVTTYFSNGAGTFTGGATTDLTIGDATEKTIFVEVNGDGLVDLLITRMEGDVNKIYTYLSDGDGTFTYNGQTYVYRYPGKDHFGDVNGDGLTDFITYFYVNDPYWQTNQVTTYFSNGGGPPDLATLIDNGNGGTTTIQYTPSSQYNNTFLPFITHPVSSITTDDGLGNQSTTTYGYSGGLYDYPTREFRGFEYVKQTNPDNTTYESWFHQDEFRKGRASKTQLNKSEDLLIEETLTWDTVYLDDPDNTTAFVKLSQKRTDYYDSATVFAQEDYFYEDTNGNLTTVVAYGTDGENVTTSFQYQNKGDWLWCKTEETVQGSLSGKVRETYFEYENNTGNLLLKESWLDGGSNPSEEMTYDDYGNRISLTDARGNTTATEYDTDTHTYPVIITSPATGGVAHIEQYQYDHRYGRETAKEDENGNWTYYDFDPFGRLKQVDYPDGGQKINEYYECNDPDCQDTIFPRYIIQKVKEDNAGNYIDKYTYYDGLNREIQSITFGENSKSIVTRRFYDEMGRNDLNEGPFFSTGTGYPKEPPTDYFFEETSFDERGRPVEISSPHGEYGTVSITFDYSGFTTVTTDPDGSQKTDKKDYLDRIIQVIEHADAGLQYTNYAYNAAADLLSVMDHHGNVTTIVYDTLGRKTNMDDPDMGFWQYTYDLNGNLKTQTDAEGQIISFDYDELNRITSKSYSTSDSTVTYAYDDLAITYGRGRLYSVTNSDVTTVYNAYDEMGREESITKTITGSSYTTLYGYDLSGKLISTTYPDNYQVTYGFYPGTGLLHTVVEITDLVGYATCTDYEPTGKIGKIEHANGTATLYTYDPKSTKLYDILTQDPSGTPENDLQRRQYSYTRAGDIRQITDDLRNITYNYTYDKLHRLLTETNTGGYDPLTYTYDAIGNITSQSAGSTTANYIYDTVHKHTVNQISLYGTDYYYTYDDNGNMTSGPDFTDPSQITSRTITYNADNMPVQIEHAGTVITDFIYDGDGVRAKKAVQGGGATYYVNENYEIINGEPVGYIFAGNLRIAKITASGRNYFHKDHLGSSTVMTDETGTQVEVSEYMPYGHMRDHAGTEITNYKFTDQELDTSTNLYNYDARMYDPVVGRFISADSIIPDYYDPQMLNRYAYCRNNPLIYVDPDGHFHVGIGFGALSGAIAGAITGINGTTSFGAAVIGGIVGGITGTAVGAAVGAVAPQASSAVAVGAVSGLMGGILGGATARATNATVNAMAKGATPIDAAAKGVAAAANPTAAAVDGLVGVTSGTMGGLGYGAAAGAGKVGQTVAKGIVESTTARAGGLLGSAISGALKSDEDTPDTMENSQPDDENSDD